MAVWFASKVLNSHVRMNGDFFSCKEIVFSSREIFDEAVHL